MTLLCCRLSRGHPVVAMPLDDNFVYMPPQEPLSILYEDDDLVVIEKPAGLLSVPGVWQSIMTVLIFVSLSAILRQKLPIV